MEQIKKLSDLGLQVPQSQVEPGTEGKKSSFNRATYTKEYFLAKEEQQNSLKSCLICGGSGLVLNAAGMAEKCVCLKEKLLRERRKKAKLSPALLKMHFANFDLAYYPTNQKPQGGQYLNKSYYDFAKNAKTKAESFVKNVALGKNAKGLLLQGSVGSGKTHLAAAIANAFIQAGGEPLFLVVPDFLEEIRASFGEIGEFSESELMAQARNAKVLILDDLGSHNFSEWTQNKIFLLLNHRLNNELPCVVTSNLDIDNLTHILGQRTVSRLIAGCEPCLLPVPQDIRLSISKGEGF